MNDVGIAAFGPQTVGDRIELHVGVRLRRLRREIMQGRTEHPVEKHIAARPVAVVHARDTVFQLDMAIQPGRPRRRRRHAHVIRLHRPGDDQRVAAERQRMARIEFQLAHLVAAEAQSRHIVAFDVNIGGYVKADAMWSSYSDGDLAANSAGRQFYIPGTIPVGGASENADVDFQAVESRINFSAAREENGHKLSFFAEMDFMLSGQGDERVSNSYSPRMRHYFMKYDNWLFGQTWSTFQDVAALAENLDFVGPAEGTIFVRQTQVRYTNGNLELALENPETTVTPNGGGSRIVTDDGGIPDMVARYYFRGDWGHVAVAGLYRDLTYDSPAGDTSDSGLGISLSGKLNVGTGGDDLRFMITSGSGLGRYIGLNTTNAAVIDASGDLEAIDSTGGFVSYLHRWNSEWRSNLTYSFLDIDNDINLTGTGVTSNVWSVHANLLYSPTPKTTFGVEYLTAERELEGGASGDMDRLILSAKYAF